MLDTRFNLSTADMHQYFGLFLLCTLELNGCSKKVAANDYYICIGSSVVLVNGVSEHEKDKENSNSGESGGNL